ncbi:MAG: UDP-N-acetylmuramate dehydrogenase [Oceanicoccus sp.]|jgi:UDP-N-acetylmuramate dehydrogenase
MLSFQQHKSLRCFNTLAVDVNARWFVQLDDEQQLPEALAYADKHNLPVLVLGGGSNVVLAADFDGLVINVALLGVDVEIKNRDVIVTAAAGENWHNLVQVCLVQGFYGLENLSLIPGSVGAAPIQNIGAYGVELSQCFVRLRGWDIQQSTWRELTADDCDFGYRDSVFKNAFKSQFIITSVSLKLSLDAQVSNSYAALQQYFDEAAITQPSPQQVAAAVIEIRQCKLPDPAELANAGSFFKNPVISELHAEQLKQQWPALVSYPQASGKVKLAAGWLLEQAGWKGERQGEVGMHQQQALVLVNYGKASGSDILSFAHSIQQDIYQKFGLSLEIEPAIIAGSDSAAAIGSR